MGQRSTVARDSIGFHANRIRIYPTRLSYKEARLRNHVFYGHHWSLFCGRLALEWSSLINCKLNLAFKLNRARWRCRRPLSGGRCQPSMAANHMMTTHATWHDFYITMSCIYTCIHGCVVWHDNLEERFYNWGLGKSVKRWNVYPGFRVLDWLSSLNWKGQTYYVGTKSPFWYDDNVPFFSHFSVQTSIFLCSVVLLKFSIGWNIDMFLIFGKKSWYIFWECISQPCIERKILFHISNTI